MAYVNRLEDTLNITGLLIGEPRLSSTKKTYVVATERIKSGIIIDGKPVVVQVTAYIDAKN